MNKIIITRLFLSDVFYLLMHFSDVTFYIFLFLILVAIKKNIQGPASTCPLMELLS